MSYSRALGLSQEVDALSPIKELEGGEVGNFRGGRSPNLVMTNLPEMAVTDWSPIIYQIGHED